MEEEEVKGDDSNLSVPNMQRSEVNKILEQDCEERAALLFETFHKLTSVIYDIQSMAAILKREDLTAST